MALTISQQAQNSITISNQRGRLFGNQLPKFTILLSRVTWVTVTTVELWWRTSPHNLSRCTPHPHSVGSKTTRSIVMVMVVMDMVVVVMVVMDMVAYPITTQ